MARPVSSDWELRANCRGANPELFFPERIIGRNHRKLEGPAKELCRACEVRYECLATALRRNEPDGVWGGFNTRERMQIRKQAKHSPDAYELLMKHLEEENKEGTK